MKSLILAAALLFSTHAFAEVAKDEPAVCETLLEQAGETCTEVLAEQCKEYGETECTQDGDYGVAYQECQWSEMESLMEEHNKANPQQQITCGDY